MERESKTNRNLERGLRTQKGRKKGSKEKWMKGRNFREREGARGGGGGGREKWMKGRKERGREG